MGNLFILAQEKSLIMDAIRTFFAYIDGLVFFAVSLLFRAIFNLANFDYIKLYELIEGRIYVILGIFMLFKVTVSLLTYLVNPDKITDKEQGATKLVTRIIIVLVMLIGLPTFFSLMTEFQNKLLPVIPRVIMGTTTELSMDNVNGIAQEMSMNLLRGFAEPAPGCGGGTLNDFFDLANNVKERCTNDRNLYMYEYKPIISTIIGILSCYVVFSLCISVAIRAFKLIILRMIAPIPVISYIDPKSAKDGAFSHWSKTFLSTWAELFIHIGMIYLIVYLIQMIFDSSFWSNITLPGGSGSALMDGIDGTFLIAFLIIGLLFFAKSAPQFIFDALGIKNKGAFTKMLGMGAAALGGVGSARAAFRARQEHDAANGGNSLLKGIRNAGASLFSGAASSMAAGNAILSSDKPTLKTGFDAQAKSNATMLSRINAGSTLIGRFGSMGQMLIAGESNYDRMNREIQIYEDANKALVAYKNDLEKKALEQIGDGKKGIRVDVTDTSGNVHTGLNYNEFMNHTAGAQNGDAESLQWFIDNGWSKQVQTGTRRVWDAASHSYINQPVYETVADWQGAQAIIEDLKTAQINEHANRVVNGHNGMSGEDYDGTSYNTYQLAKNATDGVPELSVDFQRISGNNGVKANLGRTNTQLRNRKMDPKYKAAKANAEATKK